MVGSFVLSIRKLDTKLFTFDSNSLKSILKCSGVSIYDFNFDIEHHVPDHKDEIGDGKGIRKP